MKEGDTWNMVSLYFEDNLVGVRGVHIKTEIVQIIYNMDIISYCIIKEKEHFNKNGMKPSVRLFGSVLGSTPIIMQVILSEQQLNKFIRAVELLLVKTKGNIHYQIEQLHTLNGVDNTDKHIENYL